MGAAITTVGILGIGELAGFILQGAAGGGYRFILSPRSAYRAADLAKRFGAEVASDNQAVCDLADLVVVCLPADTGADILAGLRFRPGQAILSAMAGVNLATLERAVAPARAYCTMMPGHANALGLGPSLLFPDSPVWKAFLARLGPVHVFSDADQFETASVFGGFSGASFAFMIRVINWFTRHGIDPHTARALVAETLIGNANVLSRVDAPLDEIASGVATPGGITERCIDALNEQGSLDQWSAALDSVRLAIKLKNQPS